MDFCEINGRYLLKNVAGETYNVINNERVTVCQPDTYNHTIYVIGTCIVRGYGVSDESTIPSMLQKTLLNKGYKNYIVRNLGTGGGLNIYSDIRDFVNILNTNTKEGDIVLHIGYNCWDLDKAEVTFNNYFELSWLFNRKCEKRCFLNASPHLTLYSNKIITNYIFENIKDNLLSY